MDIKEQIIENASMLFLRNGIKSITMSDIANSMGISKRTLYEVFSNKNELLETCVSVHTEFLDRKIKALIDNSENIIEILMNFYSYYFNDICMVNKSFFHDIKKHYFYIHKKVEDSQEKRMKSLMPLFKKGVEQGLIRKDINFEIIFWLVRCQFKALIDDNYIPTDKYSVNEFISAIMLNFVRGIVTSLGYEKIDIIISEFKIERNLQEKN
ncbi:MAG: TetR/AcrR family transcriptional regulator [Dysgonamonadaceae bacterium]|jgi:AcrR family transcriptional regulator|nr:TetR/AcrR family transcriptional regulator [Dysgonamonadaceae bacterium]